MPEAHARADGDPAHARGALRRHAGHRVHGRGGAASTCSRRATPSARRRRRCASPSTRSTRGCSTREQALTTIDAGALDALLHPTFDPRRRLRGARDAASPPRPARPRARSSSPPTRRSTAAAEGRDVILVRPFTEADDVAGFHAAQGHPHLRGRQGLARRARRARHGPAVRVPAPPSSRSTSQRARRSASATRCSREGDLIAIDGTDRAASRRRRAARRARGRASSFETRARVGRRAAPLGVRANADTPEDAAQGARVRRRGHRPLPHRAHVHGRGPPAEDAGDDHGRRPRTSAAPRSPSCCRSSRRTSRACSRRWTGCRSRSACSTRRCTSSCPTAEDAGAARSSARGSSSTDDLEELEQHARARPRARARTNPMLGTRGCRLGILYPEIYEMQVAAIIARGDRGARADRRGAAARDHDPARRLRAGARADARAGRATSRDEHGLRGGRDFTVGTMIELPRACFVADRIADARRLLLVRHQRPHADGARLLARRRRVEVPRRATWSARSSTARPFETIDEPGVGWLVRLARVGRARGEAGPQARHLRRARRRPGLDRLLPHGRARLRVLLAVPRADRARGGGAGGGAGAAGGSGLSRQLASASATDRLGARSRCRACRRRQPACCCHRARRCRAPRRSSRARQRTEGP